MSSSPPDPEGSVVSTTSRLSGENFEEAESSTSAQNQSRRATVSRITPNWYLPHLDAHISQSKSRLRGDIGVPTPREFNYATTVVPPLNTLWDPSLKARFFAALSRYSRLRPELIALDLDRTEGEVKAYLDLLEEGAQAVKRSQGGDRGYRDRSKRWGGSTFLWLDGFASAAMEASEEWVDAEEDAAVEVGQLIQRRTDEAAKIERDAAKKGRLKAAKLDIKGGGGRLSKKQRQALNEVEAGFERETEREAWLASVDREALSQLNEKLDPSQHALDTCSTMERTNPIRQMRRKYNKNERIVLDDKAIEYITAIPPDQRTAKQKAGLTTLKNRKKVREGKRMKRLSEKGLGDEEVALLGGADAVHEAQKEDLGVNLGDMTGEKWYTLQFEGVAGVQTQGEEVPDSKLDADKMILLAENATQDGWEVFNLNKINELLGPADENSNEAAVSAVYLALLREELIAFLTPLVLHAIVTAEQVSSQYGETLSAPTAAVSEIENEDQHCVTRYHVDAALALKGAEITLLEPTANVKIVGAKGEGRAKNNGGVENGVVHTRKHLAKASVVHRGHQNESHKNEVAPPAHVAWNVMDLHPTHTSSTSRTESPIYSTNDNVAAQPSEEESVKWEIETTLTDMEDEALDEYMEMMDETLDRYTEDKLWNGENEEYLDTTSSIRDAAVNEAQKNYEMEYFRTMAARRWRRSVNRRSERFPTTRLHITAAAARGKKSQMMVVDDDEQIMDLRSEDEDEDEGEEGSGAEFGGTRTTRKRGREGRKNEYARKRRRRGDEGGEEEEREQQEGEDEIEISSSSDDSVLEIGDAEYHDDDYHDGKDDNDDDDDEVGGN